ncbi:hypothetical protein HDIA_1031 [Hartmannibacter diazotrophicus]|uniref:Oxygen tolerance n=1 Tax=Hartmannibacter diazotrophicus TaxID=1482074 RepID=A0A2C9D2N7_9HYPH|nr:BatD family protein [Hartmannibacter diazotrophicus]SON54572.1 hypothetical protein HDIA_1031 [Hartmannibacter diazotrophicus]
MVRWLATVLFLISLCGSAFADGRDRLEVTVDKPNPLPGEMILVTVRGEYVEGIGREHLEMPAFPGFNWIQLERDKWTSEGTGASLRKVFERRLAFFAKSDGTLVIPSFLHHVTVVTSDNKWVETETQSAPVTITVKPQPKVDGRWMPASSVELTDDWSRNPEALIDGDNVRRTITLKVLGADPERLPPAPVIREPWLISFTEPEQREIVPTPNGPLATLTWSWKLRPITGEVGTLPAVDFAWFDTATGTSRNAALGPRRIAVAGFGTNAAGVWPSRFASPYGLLFAAAAGLILPLGILFFTLRPLSQGERMALKRAVLRRLPSRDRLALRMALGRGDLASARRAALSWFQRQNLDRAEQARRLSDLDAVLFGHEAAAPAPDRARLRRQLLS